jgi:hypothetical protein
LRFTDYGPGFLVLSNLPLSRDTHFLHPKAVELYDFFVTMSNSNKSPSLRRIQADIRELALDPSDRYNASPLESDMFEW